MEETKMKRKKPAFKRQSTSRYSKLGNKRRKKQKWRKAKGRDSKIRLAERGYIQKVRVGWGSAKKDRKEIVRIENLKQLENVGKGKEIMIAKVGKKKREEILKIAKEKGLGVLNRYLKNKSEGEEKCN